MDDLLPTKHSISEKYLIRRILENSSTISNADVLTEAQCKSQFAVVLNKLVAKRKEIVANISTTQQSLQQLERELVKKENSFFGKLFSQKETLEQLQSQITAEGELLNNLKTELENAVVTLDNLLEGDLDELYKQVVAAFDQLKDSNKIWDITSERANVESKSSASSTVERAEVTFAFSTLDYIQCNYPALLLQNADGKQMFVYPGFVLLLNGSSEINVKDLKELNIKFRPQRFIESEALIPSDSKVVDKVWAKVNKDGSPDLRFRGNYQQSVVKYGSFELAAKEMVTEIFYFSNYEASEGFAQKFAEYLFHLKGEESGLGRPFISREYFDSLKEFSTSFLEFIKRLQTNYSFTTFIKSVKGIETLGLSEGAEIVDMVFTIDLIKCFSMAADLYNMNSKESFAILYLHFRKNNIEVDYATIDMLYAESVLSSYRKLYDTLKDEIKKSANGEGPTFHLAPILRSYDMDLQEEYLSNMYRFASIVIKSDGKVTKQEEAALKRIMSVKEQREEQVKEQGTVKVIEESNSQSAEEVLQELNELIGLSAVKAEINTLVNFIRIQKAREASGLKSSSLSYHIVFTGNPGTGKTTVARIISKIYKSLGVLSEGQLVETDRSGLIAEYVGQTAVKVNKVVDSALNGVLFIDEAYSIAGEGKEDFGNEAVATLIKRMEDDRDKLVVILAGYTAEMERFIDTNPGFKSRFNRYIEFSDYTPTEMVQIFELHCTKLDYKLTSEAREKLVEVITKAYSNRDAAFGNGRFVRNLFEKALEKQANRLACELSLDKETLTTLVVGDVSI